MKSRRPTGSTSDDKDTTLPAGCEAKVDQGLKVLLVDDTARTRRSMRALLATWPQVGSFEEAASGIEALQAVEAGVPDAILMDIRMAPMDGLEATRIIRARWPKIKIIALSMYSEFAEDALAAGADAFVGKGEPPESLLQTLRNLIGSENRE